MGGRRPRVIGIGATEVSARSIGVLHRAAQAALITYVAMQKRLSNSHSTGQRSIDRPPGRAIESPAALDLRQRSFRMRGDP